LNLVFSFRETYNPPSQLRILMEVNMIGAPATRVGLIWALIVVLLPACSSVLRNPLPADIHGEATVLGRDDLRYWGDRAIPLEERFKEVEEADGPSGRTLEGISNREHHYLAISGGGANGAYGAGLLVGWTALGTRPDFTMVTGISTGALTAPFAFLGPKYDPVLKKVYTTTDTTQIVDTRSVFSIVGGDSIVDTSPLSRTIEKYVTDEVIAEIAAEYRTGRSLVIGTTNLDAGRSVLWNIGRIATSGHPDAPDLIRMVLRASASIPGVFPPVYIPVQVADGSTYDEMHVDGGTSSQMFLYPAQTDWETLTEQLGVHGTPTAYLIRNSRVEPRYEPVAPHLLPIAGKTIDSLIRTQGIGDFYRIYTIAQRDNIHVKLAWIPEEAGEDTSSQAFDPEYMSQLFEFGYRHMVDGEAWIDVARAIQSH
jgi:predicted acylesterase/phospholipase RssA